MKKEIPKFSKKPTFNSSTPQQPINMFVSPLVSHLKSDWVTLGTGVIIASGFGLTAKHVVTALIERFENIQIDKPSNSGPQNLVGTHNTSLFQQLNGKTLLRWSVRQCFLSLHTDVCFLRLDPAFNMQNYAINQKIKISLKPPQIGERIVGYGFPKSSVDANENKIRVNVNPRTTVGEVTEIFPKGRDKMIPFPVFRTNARFDPGMSGGPVFNESGMLCGLICSNLPPDNPDLDHISYVTLLWPSMSTMVFLNLKNHKFDNNFPVLFLAEHNYIPVDGWEFVKIQANNQIFWEEP